MSYQMAKGWLMPEERELLFSLAKASAKFPHPHLLNVGTEFGASVICLHEGNPEAKITTLDIRPCIMDMAIPSNVTFIEADSTIFDEKSLGEIHVAFIDGNHGYSAVLLDCRFADLIPAGGTIAFHDCLSWEENGQPHAREAGVNIAVSEWYAANQNKWVEGPFARSIRWFVRK